jgi:hypothetical protein
LRHLQQVYPAGIHIRQAAATWVLLLLLLLLLELAVLQGFEELVHHPVQQDGLCQQLHMARKASQAT